MKFSAFLTIYSAMSIVGASAEVTINATPGNVVRDEVRDNLYVSSDQAVTYSLSEVNGDLYARVEKRFDDTLTPNTEVSFSAESDDELQMRKKNFLKSGAVKSKGGTITVLDSFKAY